MHRVDRVERCAQLAKQAGQGEAVLGATERVCCLGAMGTAGAYTGRDTGICHVYVMLQHPSLMSHILPPCVPLRPAVDPGSCCLPPCRALGNSKLGWAVMLLGPPVTCSCRPSAVCCAAWQGLQPHSHQQPRHCGNIWAATGHLQHGQVGAPSAAAV
jgi:hypothetical protein